MITIETFVFNDFKVNTYLLFDETKEAIIIDPACYSTQEKEELSRFIHFHNLKLVHQYNTHCHIDHILGNAYILQNYQAGLSIHQAGNIFLHTSPDYAAMFGLNQHSLIEAEHFIKDGDLITFGQSCLHVLYTPGHADGSVCFHSPEQKFVISGDVLFQGSIGRTDLPTGDFKTILSSIREKLFTLDDYTTVYPGHGPATRIGFEKKYNPFLQEERN